MRRDSLTRTFSQRHSGPLLLLFESVRFDNWFALKNRVLLIKQRFGKIPSLIQVLLPFIVSKSNPSDGRTDSYNVYEKCDNTQRIKIS